MATANNKANVSTTKAVKGGYFFSAPIGTAGAPTKTTFTTWASSVPSGWENLGYIPEDGFTETADMDTGDPIRDVNLEKLDDTEGAVAESVTVALMEMAYAALATQFGHSNVTDENGVLEVLHNWSQASEHRQYVFCLLLKDNRKWVKYIPDGKVTSLGDFTGNKTTVAQREVTITYNDDEDGTGCYDWMESTETPAPTLTALSGVTLSPTFSASTRVYTATTTSSSVSLTATAASGNTVKIYDANGNIYNSGNSVPMVTGTNKLTIIVTNTESGAKGVYTLTITK